LIYRFYEKYCICLRYALTSKIVFKTKREILRK
jgi:hypothetical protein